MCLRAIIFRFHNKRTQQAGVHLTQGLLFLGRRNERQAGARDNVPTQLGWARESERPRHVQEADVAAATVRERSFRAFLDGGGAASVTALELDIVSCAVRCRALLTMLAIMRVPECLMVVHILLTACRDRSLVRVIMCGLDQALPWHSACEGARDSFNAAHILL